MGDCGRSRRSATPFSELNDLLTDFVARVRSILRKDLVGVYLMGSFALGGGDAASDCDFLVVTTGRVVVNTSVRFGSSMRTFPPGRATGRTTSKVRTRRRPIFKRWQRSDEHGCTSTAAAATWNGQRIEAASRMLYTFECGEVISKQDALDWATVAMPSAWRDLIDQVRQDRFVRWNDPPRPGSVERTLAFIAHVQERVRAGEGPAVRPSCAAS